MTQFLKNIQGDKAIWAVVTLLAVFSFLPVYSASSNLVYVVGNGTTMGHLVKHGLLRTASPTKPSTPIRISPPTKPVRCAWSDTRTDSAAMAGKRHLLVYAADTLPTGTVASDSHQSVLMPFSSLSPLCWLRLKMP